MIGMGFKRTMMLLAIPLVGVLLFFYILMRIALFGMSPFVGVFLIVLTLVLMAFGTWAMSVYLVAKLDRTGSKEALLLGTAGPGLALALNLSKQIEDDDKRAEASRPGRQGESPCRADPPRPPR